MQDFLSKAKAIVVGHAVGDALGVPVEFRSRKHLDANPVTEMTGYGSYKVPKGSWSDDTSMSLCALEAVTADRVDFERTMQNFFKWLFLDEFTPTGKVFDVGNTCREAISNFAQHGLPYDKCGLSDEYSNGNGSLMRIHPVVLAKLYGENDGANLYANISEVRTASALTHAHPRSRLACIIYYFVLRELVKTPCKQSIVNGLRNAKLFYEDCSEGAKEKMGKDYICFIAERSELGAYGRLFDGIGKLPRDEVQSDGYVVHTLEASIWCLLTTESYAECVLKAVNLGHDTDTTGAVAGGLAGALYGYDAIPLEWRNTLIKREYIEQLCDKAFGK